MSLEERQQTNIPDYSNDEIYISDDLKELLKQKMDPILFDIVTQNSLKISVIIQTPDGLKNEDRSLVEKLGGKIKHDLYIINAFSADIMSEGLIELAENPRITRIYLDAEVRIKQEK
jgi:hypothetical protein